MLFRSICQPSDAKAAANTIHDTLKIGGVAYVVCADAAHRFGVEHFEAECHRVGLTVKARDAKEAYYEGKLAMNCNSHLEQTAGYIESMTLTMFTIRKTLEQ